MVSSRSSKHISRLVPFALSLILSGLPSLVFAQAQLQSTNYILDGPNIGSVFPVTTNQDTNPPSITSIGPKITELAHNRATISWSTDKKSTSIIQFGETTAYGQEAGSSSESVTEHIVTLTNLRAETEYNFRVKSVDVFGNVGHSENRTFKTPADKGINNIKISDVTYTSALVSWTTGNSTTEEVHYGRTTSYDQSVKGKSASYTTNHTVKLENLTSGVEYHVQIISTTEKGEIDRSSDFGFITTADPKFETVTAVPKSANEVEIRWRTNTKATGLVSYRASNALADTKDQTAGTSTYDRNQTVSIKNLIGNETYRFEVTATDEHGKQVKSGARTFTTPTDTEPPVISALRVSPSRSGDRLLFTATWLTNEPAKSGISYIRKDTGDTVELPLSTGLNTSHTAVGTDLTPSTTYVVKAQAVDPAGNSAIQEITFVSPKLPQSIFQLIAGSVAEAFGWLIELIR